MGIYENLVITIQLEILTQHIRSLQNLSNFFLCKKKTKLDSLKSTAFLFAGILIFHSRIERTGQIFSIAVVFVAVKDYLRFYFLNAERMFQKYGVWQFILILIIYS